jgi:NAD+ synthase (glutamine-hydrolysing)
MKIALSQQNYILGDFQYNVRKIKQDIDKAIKDQAELIVFSELCMTGYPPTDFFYFEEYYIQIENNLEELKGLSHQIGIILGAPRKNPNHLGKDYFNSAYFLHQGEIKQIVDKTLLPTYDIFDEYRYFEPNKVFKCIEFKGKKIALTICEDIWDINANSVEEINWQALYQTTPMEQMESQKPDLMINISASPFSYSHSEERKKVVIANCKKYHIPMIYVSAVGGQTELVFDGGSMLCNSNGDIVYELKYFEEDYAVIDPCDKTQAIKVQDYTEKVERKYLAIVLGIRDYFSKLGFKKAVLGLSGGVDSALTLALASEAIGAENVLSILMPSPYSTDHSINDAIQICKNLGSPYEIIPIKENFEQIKSSLNPVFKDKTEGLTEENIQARIRGILLMAVSNKLGPVLLNTSNKSEVAVGYGTLYGDMCGGLAVLGDVYKTEVYELCTFINRNSEIIPQNTISKPPSAELRPGQKDQDSLPEYDILDAILYQYINKQHGVNQIVAMGYDRALTERIFKMVNRNEFKRYQTPPIIRVSSKAFGFGRRIPIVAKY